MSDGVLTYVPSTVGFFGFFGPRRVYTAKAKHHEVGHAGPASTIARPVTLLMLAVAVSAYPFEKSSIGLKFGLSRKI